jgi:NitT/TauT family transport system substrate-binding protein
MTEFTRRALLSGGSASAMALATPGGSLFAADVQKPLSKLIFSGPPAPPTIYLAHLAATQSMKAQADEIDFKTWMSPDVLIAQVLNAQVHVGATPSNTAATLYNKGARIALLDITTWGVLHVLTRRDDVKSFTDLKGKSLLSFFRGGMPDIVMRYMAKKLGFDLVQEVKLSYATNPMLAMNLFLAGKAETVLLPEPAATAVELRSRLAGRPLNRIDVQRVWTEITGRPRTPQAGTLIQRDLIESRPELAQAVKAGIGASVEWMNKQPDEMAKFGAAQFGLPAPIIKKSLQNVRMEWVPAREAREELEFFFEALMELSPALVGGKLPDDNFYFG